MNASPWIARVCALLTGVLLGHVAQASGIEMVTIGNPGNAPDTRYNDIAAGSVSYVYRIGKFEVTAAQYTELLNAVAGVDTYNLYNASMDASAGLHGCNIKRISGSGTEADPYVYGVDSDWASRPVNFVNWGDAARFCNWLANDRPRGAQGPRTTEDGSYVLNGAMSNTALAAVVRKPYARYVIPTDDEWYKAAYHKNDGTTGNYFDFPTGTNTSPGRDKSEATNPGNNANYYGSPYPIDSPYYTTIAGEFQLSDSPYGTFDQGGNVWEWNEAVPAAAMRALRGGSFVFTVDFMNAKYRAVGSPTYERDNFGFRIAQLTGPVTPADLNDDGFVDETDRDLFFACVTGPAIRYDPSHLPDGCTLTPDAGSKISADFDRDADVDMADFGVFQRCYPVAAGAIPADCAQ
jgi:formylglycine-generating enzyme required for sulfatase activity